MQKPPPKKDVLTVLLDRSTVFIHLDPRSETVIVPPGFKKEPRLVLQIGHTMAVPIPDLTVNEEGWSGTLSFRKVPFRCVVPWSAVFAMVGEDGRWLVWPEDVPPELEKPKPTLSVAPAPAPDAAPNEKLEKVGAPGPSPLRVAPAPAPVAVVAVPAVEARQDKDEAKKAKSKAKRAKKKGERPALKAANIATDAASAGADAAQPPGRGEPEKAPDGPRPVTPAVTPLGRGPATDSSRPPKPKRELPHYIRVIK
ncbi:MAG: hypothetical protein IPG50_15085 [Myxococcales bacterium]|nr:hypothetical protein [Myxococcales bacterium]